MTSCFPISRSCQIFGNSATQRTPSFLVKFHVKRRCTTGKHPSYRNPSRDLMLYRCRGAQAHDLLNVRIVSRRKYVVTHTCYRTSTSRGIQSLNITRCTCSGLHSTSSRNTIQHAVKVALASVICLTIVSLGKPAAANNVVRKQQSSDTYAAASLNDRGRNKHFYQHMA